MIQTHLDVKFFQWVEAVLANDDNSTDEELVKYFMKEGKITEDLAKALVSDRNKFLY